ncbi:MAG: DUF539 domain-containing protein [Myxococcota bacterium]
MATFLAALVIFATVLSGMAVGVVFQGRRLRGSCGGTGLDCTCSTLAARSCPIRREREARQHRADSGA